MVADLNSTASDIKTVAAAVHELANSIAEISGDWFSFLARSSSVDLASPSSSSAFFADSVPSLRKPPSRPIEVLVLSSAFLRLASASVCARSAFCQSRAMTMARPTTATKAAATLQRLARCLRCDICSNRSTRSKPPP